jgi:hypothetical protein
MAKTRGFHVARTYVLQGQFDTYSSLDCVKFLLLLQPDHYHTIMSAPSVDAQITAETSSLESLRRQVFTRAPFAQLYLLSTFLTTLLRLPFYLIYYIPAATRPHPQWTYRQAVRTRLIKTFLFAISFVENVTPLSLEPGKDGDSWQVVERREDSVYQGVLRSDASILPERTGGTWYPHKPSNAKEDIKMLVLHIHGK